MPPEEWNTFMDCLRSELPAAFRINSRSVYFHYHLTTFLLTSACSLITSRRPFGNNTMSSMNSIHLPRYAISVQPSPRQTKMG